MGGGESQGKPCSGGGGRCEKGVGKELCPLGGRRGKKKDRRVASGRERAERGGGRTGRNYCKLRGKREKGVNQERPTETSSRRGGKRGMENNIGDPEDKGKRKVGVKRRGEHQQKRAWVDATNSGGGGGDEKENVLTNSAGGIQQCRQKKTRGMWRGAGSQKNGGEV